MLIDDTVREIFTYVFYSVLCQIINVFGIFTNIINIICFVKQGFNDSINISLLGLSVSDLGSLITLLCACIFLTPSVMTGSLHFDSLEVGYLTSEMPHLSFTRVSSCITAMITLERCLCITAPLQIKGIITPRRTAAVTICIFIIFFCTVTPIYVVSKLDMKFSAERNTTIFGLVVMENRINVEKVSFAFNNFAIPFGAFLIIVICTTILSIKLKDITKWRQATITSTQLDRVSVRNMRVAKGVVIISALFIVCFIPNSISMLAVAFIPDLAVHGKYINLTIILGGFGYTLESINSSMNIFIYYKMSRNYRDSFRWLLFRSKVNEQAKVLA